MRKGTSTWVSGMAVFAAVLLSSASLFGTQLIPITERDPALVGPINDSPTGGKMVINPPAAVVPEPTTWGMLILGGGLLTAVRRFRRKHM